MFSLFIWALVTQVFSLYRNGAVYLRGACMLCFDEKFTFEKILYLETQRNWTIFPALHNKLVPGVKASQLFS